MKRIVGASLLALLLALAGLTGRILWAHSRKPAQEEVSALRGDVAFDDSKNPGITWSPDGKRIAYKAVRGDKEFVVLHEQGRVREGRVYDEVRDLLFSPDGGALVYVAKRKDHSLMVINDKEESEYDTIHTYDIKAVFNPLGTRMAYFASRGDRSFIVIDGQEAKFPPDSSQRPVWSPDGNSWAYIAKRFIADQHPKLFMVSDGQAGKEYDDIAGSPVFRAEERQWAYIAKEAEVWVLVVGQKEVARYAACSRSGLYAATSSV